MPELPVTEMQIKPIRVPFLRLMRGNGTLFFIFLLLFTVMCGTIIVLHNFILIVERLSKHIFIYFGKGAYSVFVVRVLVIRSKIKLCSSIRVQHFYRCVALCCALFVYGRNLL